MFIRRSVLENLQRTYSVTERLALGYKNLTDTSRKIDNDLRVVSAAAYHTIASLPPGELSWQEVEAAMMHDLDLEPDDNEPEV